VGASGQHQAPEDGGSLTLLRVGRIIVYFVYALAVAATVILSRSPSS
jgi:hypothetical protein